MAMRVLPHFLLWRFGLAPAQTQTTRRERDAIARHASGRRTAVEVGVWHGVTTSVIKSALSPDGALFAVDPFPVGRLRVSLHRLIALGETARAKGARIDWLRMTGAEAASRHVREGLPPIDFAFIDGDHSYDGLRGDWAGWSGLVASGGIVALHDTCTTAERPIADAGSVRYFDEVIREDARFEVVETVDSLSVVRRREFE